MEEGSPPAPEQAAASIAANQRPGTREWSAEQVVANTSRLLLGGLEEEGGDNPEPDERDWEEGEEDGGPPPDPLEQITKEELAELEPRQWQPSARCQEATQNLLRK